MKRIASINRKTAETDIQLFLNLDGTGKCAVNTGIGFFNHMLTLFAKHSLIDLELTVKGDLEVDQHHTVEDAGLVLGQALQEALGDKSGIFRYGFFLLPMDETLAECALDFSGRPFLVLEAPDRLENSMGFDPELLEEFFRAVSTAGGITLHLGIRRGKNTHHMIEALFKAFARAVRAAVEKDARCPGIPSSKGVL